MAQALTIASRQHLPKHSRSTRSVRGLCPTIPTDFFLFVRRNTSNIAPFSVSLPDTLGMQISLGLYYMSRTFRMVELLFDKNQSLASRNFAKLCIVMQAPLLISLLIPTIMIAIDTETAKSAVWFWLTGPLGFIFSFLFTVVFYLEWIKNRGLKITDYTVPISITSFIHRIGEFITLMLGETVLSLVLVVEGYKGNVDGYMNVATFCTCLLTATLLHFHHFASYPDHAEDHIARKSKNKGAKFMVLCLYGYSSSLMVSAFLQRCCCCIGSCMCSLAHSPTHPLAL